MKKNNTEATTTEATEATTTEATEATTTEATEATTTEAEAKAEAKAEATEALEKALKAEETKELTDVELFALFYNLLNNKALSTNELKVIVTKATKSKSEKVQKHYTSVFNLSVKYVNLKVVINFSNSYYESIKNIVNFLNKVKDSKDTFKHCKSVLSNVYKKADNKVTYNEKLMKKLSILKEQYIPKKAFKLSDAIKDNILSMSNDSKKDLLISLLGTTVIKDKSVLVTEAEAKKILESYRTKAEAKVKAEAEAKAKAEAKAEAEAEATKKKLAKAKADAEAKAKAKKANLSRKMKMLEKKITEAKTEATKIKYSLQLEKAKADILKVA